MALLERVGALVLVVLGAALGLFVGSKAFEHPAGAPSIHATRKVPSGGRTMAGVTSARSSLFTWLSIRPQRSSAASRPRSISAR